MKKIMFLLFTCITCLAYAQQYEYGLLFETARQTHPIGNQMDNSNQSISFSSYYFKNGVESSIGSHNYSRKYSDSVPPPLWLDLDFYPIPDNSFDEVSLSFYADIYRFNNPDPRGNNCDDPGYVRDANIVRKLIKRADFNNEYRVSGAFANCIGSNRVYLVHLPQPTLEESTVCLEQEITLKNGYHWQYKIAGKGWESFPESYQEKRLIKFTLKELSERVNTPILTNTSIQFRTGVVPPSNGSAFKPDEYLTPVTYDIIGCSPKWKGTSTTNETCFDSTDGSVTLTFSNDVDVAGGYKMRYYIYQGDPALFPADKLTDPDLNSTAITGVQAYGNADVVLDSEFKGRYSLLDGNFSPDGNTVLPRADYFIVYQEIKFDTDGVTVIVKSGEITPQFTIEAPTQVVIDTANTKLTQSSCGSNATLDLKAIGGNNLNPSGTYSYEFSTDNGVNWKEASNPLAIPPKNTEQRIQVRAIYSVGACIGKSTEYVIFGVPPALQFLNPSLVDVTNTKGGSIRIEYDGGSPAYNFVLSKQDVQTSVFVNVDAPVMNINDLRKSVEFTNLSKGTYKISITDADGCTKTSDAITVNSPPVPELQTPLIQGVDCMDGNNASATVGVTLSGFATANFTYVLKKGLEEVKKGTTNKNEIVLDGLSPGSYELYVIATDLGGFEYPNTVVSTEVIIANVSPVEILSSTITDTSCSNSKDGSISLSLAGGIIYEYTHQGLQGWFPLEGNVIKELEKGAYDVKVRNQNNCESNTVKINVEGPLPIEINLGEDKVICLNQELELDATIGDSGATYEWSSDNGFFSEAPIVKIAKSGIYSVVVRTATGCSATGTLSVSTSDEEISAEFAMSSQVFVGETVVAVDISYPAPDKVEWVSPDGAVILEQDRDKIEMMFDAPGEYEISIITSYSNCLTKKETKKVLVLEKNDDIVEETDNDIDRVEEFIVYPNPTSGKFSVDLKLTKPGDVAIEVYSFASNSLISSKSGKGEMTYTVPFDISGKPSGMYLVLLKTTYGNSLRKVIVE